MNTSLNIKQMVQGILSFYYVYPDGRWEFIRRIKNDVMYTGANLLARSLVGQTGMFVRGMYMKYNNDESLPGAISRDLAPSDFESLSSPWGYARVPLTASPGFKDGSSDYDVYPSGNVVTVQAQTDGTYEAGVTFDDSCWVASAALVAMPDPDDKTKDIIFSAANSDALIPKIANAQVGIKWDIKFL